MNMRSNEDILRKKKIGLWNMMLLTKPKGRGFDFDISGHTTDMRVFTFRINRLLTAIVCHLKPLFIDIATNRLIKGGFFMSVWENNDNFDYVFSFLYFMMEYLNNHTLISRCISYKDHLYNYHIKCFCVIFMSNTIN